MADPQWLHGLSLGSAAARFLELRVLIPLEAGMSVVSVVYCQVGHCVGLITRPEESYWVWYISVWSWSQDNEEALDRWGLLRRGKKITR
jgi:protein gp37